MNGFKSVRAEICKEDLKHNLDLIRKRLRTGTRICAVLKADAYGHGMSGIFRILSKERLIDMAAVGKVSELVRLHRETEDDGILVLLLGVLEADELRWHLENKRIDLNRSVFSIYSMRQFRELRSLADEYPGQIQVHIRVDGWNSGMGLGFEEFLLYEEELLSAEKIKVSGVYSHLYSSYSDETGIIRQELEKFSAFVGRIKPENRCRLTVHILNSSLIFRFPEYAFDMVRAGTAIYGLPCRDGGVLIPVMKIRAQIFDIRQIDSRAPLSYRVSGSKGDKRRIARIMMGYWDSPFLLTQKDVRFKIRGRLFYLADDVCMDNLCIDVSGDDEIRIGDTVTLMGEEGVSVAQILARNNISYVHSEWLCMTAERLEKVYL